MKQKSNAHCLRSVAKAFQKAAFGWSGIICLLLVIALPSASFASAKVGVTDDMFTLNGEKKFLLGTSYFDGMHWHVDDLEELQNNGFNLIRVWLDWWTGSHYNQQGELTDAGRQSLLQLVRKADALGIVVDIALLDNVLSFGGDSPQKREAAVRSVVRALKSEPNVIYDLFNEHRNNTGPHACGGERINLSTEEVRYLVQVAKSEDSDVIITASAGQDVDHDGEYFLDGSVLRSYNKENIKNLINTGVHFLAPHNRRNSEWAQETFTRVDTIKKYLSSIGKNHPIYIQEEMRRGGGVFCKTQNSPTAYQGKDDFFLSAKSTLDAGGAGWIFHTGAGFHLDQNSFFASLDSVERTIVQEVADHIGISNGKDEQQNDSASGLVLADPLQGSTKGSRNGGVLAASGWQTTSDNDQIVYKLASTLSAGAVEVDLQNFDPFSQCNVPKNDFIALYQDPEGQTVHANDTNTSVMYIRAGTNYIDGDRTNLKSYVSGGTEGIMKNVPDFDPAQKYTFRLEWGGGISRWLLNGKELRKQNTDSLKINYVFLGTDNLGLGGSCPGYQFSNLRVYSGDSAGSNNPDSSTESGSGSGSETNTCHTLTAVSTTSIPPGYAAPWDFFTQTKQTFFKTYCDTTNRLLTLEVGTGTQFEYTYNKGYFLKNNQWQPYTLQCSGSDNVGDWCKGSATATLDFDPSTPDYLLAYHCRLLDGQWKCGCQDQACTKPAWNLQVAK